MIRNMKEDLPQPKFLSVPEAAKICGVSRNTLYSWVRQGKLGAYKTPGRTNLIRPSDLVKFMHQNGMFVPASLIEIARKDEKLNEAVPSDGDNPNIDEGSVLVVDDDPISRSLAVRAIHETCQAYQAETGYEALHLLTKHKDIKIMLLDLHMPGQHGLETLSEIKRLRPEVSVIVVTGYADDVSQEMLVNGTVERIVEKPITLPELQNAITEVRGKLTVVESLPAAP